MSEWPTFLEDNAVADATLERTPDGEGFQRATLRWGNGQYSLVMLGSRAAAFLNSYDRAPSDDYRRMVMAWAISEGADQ